MLYRNRSRYELQCGRIDFRGGDIQIFDLKNFCKRFDESLSGYCAPAQQQLSEAHGFPLLLAQSAFKLRVGNTSLLYQEFADFFPTHKFPEALSNRNFTV